MSIIADWENIKEFGSDAPKIGVPACDLDKARSLKLPLTILGLEAGSSGLRYSEIAAGSSPELAHVHLVGLFCLSQTGSDLVEDLVEAWKTSFGVEPAVLLDVSSCAADAQTLAIASAVVSASFQTVGQQAERNVVLMREASKLRNEIYHLQAGFRELEDFVSRTNRNTRWREYEIAPARDRKPLDLMRGDEIVQRLQVSSSGLSDVSFWVNSTHSQGELDVWLTTDEDHLRVGVWSMSSEELSPGEHRLSLPVALDADAQSVFMHLRWTGKEPLKLEGSFNHPDHRHNYLLNGVEQNVVLANAAWKSTPMLRPDYPLCGKIDVGALVPSRRIATGHSMLDAVNLGTLKSDLGFVEGYQELLLHSRSRGRIAAARFENVRMDRATSVQCAVSTRHRAAPEIEYAIAVSDSRNRPNSCDKLPSFDPALMSGWKLLKPLERAQIRIDLPEELAPCCDLYLMNKLPSRRTKLDFSWASYSRVNMQLN